MCFHPFNNFIIFLFLIFTDNSRNLFFDNYFFTTTQEIEILTTHAESIALFPDEISSNQVRDFNSCIIELGAGSGKKMKPLLDATENM